MSFIFGCVKDVEARVEEFELRSLGAATQRYATGLGSVVAIARVGMGLQPYYSHQRSWLDAHPVADANGHLLSVDGRLDNHADLADELGLHRSSSSDSAIVLAAFVRWGERCFVRFIGDWAIALWCQRDGSLYLARDHAGSRTLYFLIDGDDAVWSTHLDTFCRMDKTLPISPQYAARYLAGRPVQNLTPYTGVIAVKPGHYVTIRDRSVVERTHWNIASGGEIRHRSDKEYEEHFLYLFQQSVARRTGPGAPILAELSGGMDSSSIVCLSDYLRRTCDRESVLLDTVSYFDDSEASLNDRPYFSMVETSRGKIGYHIDTAFSKRTFELHDSCKGIYRLPGADSSSFDQERSFQDAVWNHGYRSILSGIGGDELLGGVPDPLPELAGYAVSGKIRRLLGQALAWSVADRSTLAITLYQTAVYLARMYGTGGKSLKPGPPWLSSSLSREGSDADSGDLSLCARLRFAPHQLDNLESWRWIMETLPHQFPGLVCRPEYRYPFLDRDLVQFLWNIPRDQLLRPGRRRSLMRRSLAGILPQGILERRQKAFQLSAPLKKIAEAEDTIHTLFRESALERHGFMETSRLTDWIRRTATGDPTWWQALLKTISLELWLRGLEQRNPRVAEDWALTTALDFDRSQAVAKIRLLQPNSG